MIEVIIVIGVGILLGILSGLIPGWHLNTTALTALTLSPFLLKYIDPLTLAIFIISTAVTHTFVNSIPAIFLGAPESGENILTVLPGHKLLLKGKGYEAVTLTVIGSFLAILIGIGTTPLILKILPKIYTLLKDYIGYILILVTFFLIIRENNKIWALLLFLMSGLFGLTTLNINISNQLFPLLSSLFGTSTIIDSLRTKTTIPTQIIEKTSIPKKETIRALISGTTIGTFTTILPGLGPAQAAIIASQITRLTNKGFLILTGILDTLGMITSLIALFSISKARNGAIVIIGRILETITKEDLTTLLTIVLITGLSSVFITLKLAKIFSRLITKINYQKVNIIILMIITIMTIYFSSYLGLLILFIGTFIGLLPSQLGIGKNHLMGVLLLPTILFFVL
jgi:putative membrane protein